MIEKLKKALAWLALAAAAVFVLMTLWLIVTGQMAGNGNMVIIPLSVFLMLGLLSLGIRWLQDLKKKREKEQAEQGAKKES